MTHRFPASVPSPTVKPWLAALAVVALAMAAPAGAAPQPSFDCAKATADVDRAICASDALATQDASIARRFAEAKKAFDADTARALTQDQRYFVGVRNEDYAVPGSAAERVESLSDRLKYRDAFLASLVLTPRQGFEGSWDNLAGGITIVRQADGKLMVEAQAAQPQNARWLCDASGVATVKGDTLVVEADDPGGWTLTLSRKGAALVVVDTPPAKDKAAGGPPYCGMNGALGGVYFPVRQP
ncbi:hypothetical protein DVB37_20410 [Achromobacter sp. B7]|uniref:lysozyme inhibitor LprI family protein n=1 Tax=Achromobacter sp. B7 TaxID=2282475 RepID=UPI000E755524|nr:hypothetical protein [Achromobacter sp. B7]AYD66021.1 hypothetical protein DVB37_20410 [Achromobacter sp. B7]